MLNFRPIDYNNDVPEIVELLKKSLSDKHSVANFLWKHYENPFGKSYGLLASEDGEIVGVRMFMFWEFKKGNRIIKAIRPVDTVTHQAYRGKGIFKRLTLEGLKRNEGKYDMIFNTPNKSSFPGYIKMGWKKYEKSLDYYYSLLLPSLKFAKQITLPQKKDLDLKKVETLNSAFFKTNFTPDYLKWRFKSDEYSFACYQEASTYYLLVYRIKFIKGIRTLILVEFTGPDNLLKIALRGLVTKLGVFLIYYLEKKDLFKINKKSGLSIVVYKDDDFNLHTELELSLADLEGRL